MSAFTDAAGLSPASPLAPASTQPLGGSPSFDDAVATATSSTGSYNTPKPALDPSVGGFFSNLYHGFTDIVNGVVGLGKMGLHDIVGSVEQVIPGEQWAEQDIEQNGYQIATMARALPAALKSDYANRYGGVSNILRGLYENPLAYISDALMVAGGVGVAAKVGRAGAVLGKVPFTVMPESAATAVLGAGAESALGAYKPFMQVASTAVQGPLKGMEAFGPTSVFQLSRNPLTRVVQQKLVGLASLDADQATKLLSIIPEAEQARLSNTIAIARSHSIPILRPRVGPIPYNPVNTIAKFWANKAVTSKAMQIKESYQALQTKYQRIIGQGHDLELAQAKEFGAGGGLLADLEGELADLADPNGLDALRAEQLTQQIDDLREAGKTSLTGGSPLSNEAIMDIISGDRQRLPLLLPASEGMSVIHDLPVVPDGVLPAAQFGLDPVTGAPARDVFNDLWSAAEEMKLNPGQHIEGGADRYAGEVGGVLGQERPQLTVYASHMDEAPATLQQLAERTGTTIEAVVDTTGDKASSMVEFTGALRAADGTLMHVSVATPRLARAQVAGADIAGMTTAARAQASELMAEAVQLAETNAKAAMALASRADDFLRDAHAGDLLARRIFDVSRREYHAAKSGVPYDPNLWVADAMAAEHYLDITKHWIASGVGGETPFARHMAHSFLPQRVRQYLTWEANVYPKIQAVMAGAPDNASAYADLVRVLAEESMIPPAIVEDILGNAPWFRDASKAADRVMNRARKNLWPHVVTEGDRGAEFGFPEYDWATMYESFSEAGIPIPNYYPAMSVRKLSDYAMAGGGNVSLRGASPGRFARKAQGRLWETMNVNPNIEEVYSKVAAFYLRTREVNDLATTLLQRYGRKATKAEVYAWNPIEHLHEEAVSLKTLSHQLGVQADIHGDSLANIALGMDPAQAINEAFANVLDNVAQSGLDQLMDDVVIMPKAVMRSLRAQADYQLGKGSQWLRGYNSLMRLWKQAVLSLRPTWLINNMGGNTFFGLFKDPAALRHMWHTGNLRTELDSATARMMRVYFGEDTSQIVGSGFFSTMYRHEFDELSKETTGAMAEVLERSNWTKNPKQFLSRLSGKSYRMNGMIEQAARRGIFVSDLAKQSGLPNWTRAFHDTESLIKRIMSEGADTQSLRSAARGVNKVLGDYETFGPFEQYVVRQFMFPFYSFWRHAVKFLVKMPFENPYKSSMLRQIGLMDQQMYAEWPDYLRSKVKLGELGGKDLMIGLRGMNPLSFASDTMPIISNLNPLLKIGLERNMGVNTFTGEPFDDPGTIFETGDGTQWVIEKDGDGNPIGVHRVQGVVAPSWLAHVGSMLPQLSFIPSFSLYPRSLTLNLANYVGVPASTTDLSSTLAYGELAKYDAQRQMFTEAMKQ